MRVPGWSALSGAVVVGVTIVALGTYLSGFRYGGNSPVFVIPLAMATLVCCLASGVLLRAGERLVGRWMVAMAGSLFTYLASTALAAEYAGARGHDDALARLAVVLHEGGYIVPVSLIQACFLMAAVRLGVRYRRAAALVLGCALTFVLLASAMLPSSEPYTFEALWPAPPGAADVASALWMATVLAGPVLLWRAVSKARGKARRRLLVLAAASMVPIVTLVFCVLAVVLAHGFGIMSVTAGEATLAVAFCGPFLLCPSFVIAALRPGVAAAAPRLATILGGVVGVLFGLVVVAASAVLGAELAGGAVLPVVLATLVVAAVTAPLKRRVVRALVLRIDPVRAHAARLVGRSVDKSRPGVSAQDVLRAVLDDPDAGLVLRLPEGRGWAGPDGHAAPEPPPEAVMVGEAAYLVFDGEAVDAHGALAELGALIDQAVLEAAVRDQRGRAEAAAVVERRRLERDLHDGVQGRLLALALDLRMAQRDLADPEAQLILTDAAAGLSAAIDELRALATGNTPEVLSRHGLRAALAELTGRMPVPVTLNVPAVRLPPQVETVAYLVVCEAVTNALKHAGADTITVDVTLSDGYAGVTVVDDGCGGADLRAGTGLRGLAERACTAGGQLVVSDRRPHGTVLEVTLPCG
ncbi:histidine kinase [Nonomuraea sp. NPDC055795]